MALTTIDFISEGYFKEKIPFNTNVDFKDIAPHINISQDMFIQPILGSNFYNELLAKYEAQTLTPDEIVLVNHIKPSVAYRTALAAIPFLTYNVKNKGPQTQSGDFSTSVETSNLSYMNNLLENRAEFYEERLLNYLCENKNLFPGFISDNDDDIKPDDDSNYDGGFAFYD